LSRGRIICILAAAVLLALVPAGSAWAHVTANIVDARQGGFTVITFRMPNERDDAASVKLDVQFPADQPLASVSVKPVAGWTAKITKSKLDKPFEAFGEQLTEAVSQITWTAEADAQVKAGEFQEFPVSVGPLPKADTMVFKALQTYSSGEVVRWIEERTEGADEPEHPAPQIKLLPAAAEGDVDPVTTTTAAAPTATPTDDGDDAMPVAIAALVAATLALLAGIGALLAARRTGRPASGSPATG
jgi:uncharacterized protein YcnI